MTKPIKITLLILAGFVTVTAQTPIGMMRWQVDDTTQTFRSGGAYQNYLDTNDDWREIENDFHVNGSGLFVSWNRLLKTTVDSLGDVIVNYTHPYNGVEYTVIQQPHSLKWFRLSDSVWAHIDSTPNFSNVAFDSNVVSFDGMYPGVDYRVRLSPGRVENQNRFKPNFLDSLVILYDQRPDSADIYLANVMKFTLTRNIDDDTVSLGNVRRRVLKKWGGMVFEVGDTQLQGFPGADTLEIPVWQRYKFVGDQLYVLEFVKASDIKYIHELYPTETLWHNTDFILDNDTDIEDAYLDTGGGGDVNTGNAASIRLADGVWTIVIRASGLNDSLTAFGATSLTYAACSLYQYDPEPVDVVDASYYLMWNPEGWVEVDTGISIVGGVTRNDWESPDFEWITPNVDCNDDVGFFNTTDNGACNPGSGRDRKTTAAGVVTLPNSVGWVGFPYTADANMFFDSTKAHSLFFTTDKEGFSDGSWFRSRESGDGNKPFFAVTYITAAAAGSGARRQGIIKRR